MTFKEKPKLLAKEIILEFQRDYGAKLKKLVEYKIKQAAYRFLG